MEKSRMVDAAKRYGRENLLLYTVGAIKAIASDESFPLSEIIRDIKEVLSALDQVQQDESIPYKVKKAPTSIEAEEEILHPDCIVNVTKVQSLLEPWYLEQILDERMGKK